MSGDIKFDNEQLKSIVEIFRPKPSVFDRIQAYLPLIQTLALISGGLWIVFTYVSFQRDYNKLQLTQQELSTKLQSLEVETKSNVHFSFSGFDLEIEQTSTTPEGKASFTATLGFEIENTGDTEFCIENVVVDYFIGTHKDSGSKAAILRRNRPNFPGEEPQTIPGVWNWEKVDYYAVSSAHADEDIVNDIKTFGYQSLESGGGGTGCLRKGEKAFNHDYYTITASTDQAVAFTMTIGIKGPNGTEFSSYWVSESLEAVPTQETPKSRLSVPTSHDQH